MSTLSIVIPAYNEERGIAEVIRRTLAMADSLPAQVPEIKYVEVIVVNDASTDHTREMVETFAPVRLINHARNQGYGGALKTGFAASSGTYIAFLDADGTYPPELLPKLVEAAVSTGADMVVSSRMTGEKSGMPIERKLGNWGYARLLSWLSGQKVSDTASGMRVFRREILARLQPLPDGLNLTPAMSTQALLEGLKVIEVPIPYDKRVGRSKLSILKDGVRFLRTILGITWTYNPLRLFGLAGFAMLLVGFLLGLGPVHHYLAYREVPDYQIYRLFAVLLLGVTGLNLITFGVSANYVISLIRGRAQERTLIGKLLRPRRIKRLGLAGGVLLLSSVLLNTKTIYQYLTAFHITVHWSYILTGAFLFLVGAQLIMASSLMVIFDALRAQLLFTRDAGRQPEREPEAVEVGNRWRSN
jgi:glycosyltransferase involved in cell wall biosynthesis